MRGDPPRWLDIAKPKGRLVRAPLLLVLQHHVITASTLIVAPLLPATGPGSLLAPVVVLGGDGYAADLLGLSAVPLSVLGEILGSALDQADAITDGLDAIFRGHPVGLPLL
jgi:hypothetical protein